MQVDMIYINEKNLRQMNRLRLRCEVYNLDRLIVSDLFLHFCTFCDTFMKSIISMAEFISDTKGNLI